MTQLPNGKYKWPVNPTEDLKEFPVPYYSSDRWEGIHRDYDWTEVERLRGSVCVRHTLAEMGSEKLWHYLHNNDFVASLGAYSGCQAVQHVRAGMKINLPVWLAGGSGCQQCWSDLS